MDDKNIPAPEADSSKSENPKTPQEKSQGNSLPEELHTIVKPQPDPVPGSDEAKVY